MRAVTIHAVGDPSVVRVAEVRQPHPTPDEGLIRGHGSRVTPADVHARSRRGRVNPATCP